MFYAVLHKKDDCEIVFITTDAIVAVRQVSRLYKQALQNIPPKKLVADRATFGLAEILTSEGLESWMAIPFHGTKENLKTFIENLKGRL